MAFYRKPLISLPNDMRSRTPAVATPAVRAPVLEASAFIRQSTTRKSVRRGRARTTPSYGGSQSAFFAAKPAAQNITDSIGLEPHDALLDKKCPSSRYHQAFAHLFPK